MGYTATDAYGPYTDTGCSSAPTARANTEVETHAGAPTPVDTGSSLTVVQLAASHQPHRPAVSPR